MIANYNVWSFTGQRNGYYSFQELLDFFIVCTVNVRCSIWTFAWLVCSLKIEKKIPVTLSLSRKWPSNNLCSITIINPVLKNNNKRWWEKKCSTTHLSRPPSESSRSGPDWVCWSLSGTCMGSKASLQKLLRWDGAHNYVTLLPEISCTDTGSEYTAQSGAIYHVPVKNIDFGFSSKLDGSMICWPENRNTGCFELTAVILSYKQMTKISQANFLEWDSQE